MQGSMVRRTMMLAAVAVVSAGLAGCRTLAPEYTKPALPVPSAFPDAGTAEGRAAADIPWREFFGDESLKSLIGTALDQNRDLRAAVLRIERARALYRIQRSELFPSIDAGVSAGVQRTPAQVNGSPAAITADQYSVNVGVSGYEIDVFGRIRSLNAQALETFLST